MHVLPGDGPFSPWEERGMRCLSIRTIGQAWSMDGLSGKYHYKRWEVACHREALDGNNMKQPKYY